MIGSAATAGCAACVLALGLGARVAWAELGPPGAPIDTSDYTIDLYDGPILASARTIGLAGAYAPLAEGVIGYTVNPATVALRVPWSTDWFDWELDAGITLPSSITNTDFDNNGDATFANNAALFVTGGLGLQFGDFATGFTVEVNQFDVTSLAPESAGTSLRVNVTRGELVLGHTFLDGELLFGVGFGARAVAILGPNRDELASVTGATMQLGALWAPPSLPLRAGVSLRFALPAGEGTAPEGVAPDADGNWVSEGYYLPGRIVVPTEVQAAFAWQLFRPLNLRWVNPHDEESAVRVLERSLDEERARREEAFARDVSEARAAGRDTVVLEATQRTERARAAAEADARLDTARAADRERRMRPYRTMARQKLLLSAAVKVTLPTESGVGLESFFRQQVERSGETTSFSARLGVEGELVPGYLLVRAGSYYEPTRFATSSPRVHATTGFDVHVPIEWTVFGLFDEGTTFRIGGAIDAASRYFGWSLSVGIWR